MPPQENQKFINKFKNYVNSDSQKIFKLIKKKVVWLNLKYGQILIFNQQLPHGNVVNNEKETRWSLNCRFKGIFSPYADKRIGNFMNQLH